MVPIKTDDTMANGVAYEIHSGAFTHRSKSPE
jgi:hypothetical protein